MSDRFVSSGAVDANGSSTGKGNDAGEPKQGSAKNQQWEAARRQLEEERKQREEARVKAASGEEKSLYEILQANKAAKEAAFEEKNKIANQFLALDDHDVEFLDEVREKQRKEEMEKKKELEDGLKAFREAQKGGGGGEPAKDEGEKEGEGDVEETWAVGKKRRRVKEREIKGVRRKVEGEEKSEVKNGEVKTGEKHAVSSVASEPKSSQPAAAAAAAATTGLGLVAYGSDSDSD